MAFLDIISKYINKFSDSKSALFRFAKYLIILLSYIYIGYKLYTYGNVYAYFVNLNFTLSLIFVLFLVIFLMPVNWLLEAVKWRTLISKLEMLSLRQAIIGVLAGITPAIFTPNRIGEIPGRVFILKKKNRIAGLLATSLGSISQLIVTMVFGLAAFIGLITFYPQLLKTGTVLKIILTVVSALSIVILLAVYFLNSHLVQKLFNYRFLRKYRNMLLMFTQYYYSELLQVLSLSILRYVLFSLQFYFLLLFYGVDISFVHAITGISLSYFALTFIPNITLAEIGVRGSVSVFFIGMFSAHTPGIIAASASLWIINLVIPALAGSYIIFRLRE